MSGQGHPLPSWSPWGKGSHVKKYAGGSKSRRWTVATSQLCGWNILEPKFNFSIGWQNRCTWQLKEARQQSQPKHFTFWFPRCLTARPGGLLLGPGETSGGVPSTSGGSRTPATHVPSSRVLPYSSTTLFLVLFFFNSLLATYILTCKLIFKRK